MSPFGMKHMQGSLSADVNIIMFHKTKTEEQIISKDKYFEHVFKVEWRLLCSTILQIFSKICKI